MIVDKIIEQAKEHPYLHLEGYMNRYWLKPFEKDGVNIRVHHILTSDDDRHLHDHPWASTSIILKGGYWEIMPENQGQDPALDQDKFIRVWRAEGDVITRAASTRHALELPPGQTCWSMFIQGLKEQSWGFYTETGKVYWRDYLQDYTTQTASDGAYV